MAEDNTKILDDVKSGIGFASSIAQEDATFDKELIPLIDSALANLYQKGVGTNYPNRLMRNPDLTWAQFFGNDTKHDRGNAIQYVVLKTKLLFDPPLPATIQAMTQASEESLWRAGLEFDLL